MLSRTLSRRPPSGRFRLWSLAAAAAAVAVGLAAIYYGLPTPDPEMRIVKLGDAELRETIKSFLVSEPEDATRATKTAAAFGRRLFRDPALSAHSQTSCATCHKPEFDYTDQVPAPPGQIANTKSLVNVGRNIWFFADGRADSLTAAVLNKAEDPAIFATSRVAIVRYLRTHYKEDYSAAYGAFPADLPADLPDDGMPPRPSAHLPIQVSAYALSTLGAFPLIEDILSAAQTARLAPAVELAQRVLKEPQPPTDWTASFAALPAAAQGAVNEVFVNFGRALAAYMRGLTATESPFDHFAARLSGGATAKEALGAGFGDSELAGLKLFLGPGGCADCHAGPFFSDQKFHNIGLSQIGQATPLGRAAGWQRLAVDPFACAHLSEEACQTSPPDTGSDLTLVGAYRTPSLRNLPKTGPYMHDGRFATLADVLLFYSELPGRPAVGQRDSRLKPAEFSEMERAAIAAFLAALAAPVRDANLAETVSVKP